MLRTSTLKLKSQLTVGGVFGRSAKFVGADDGSEASFVGSVVNATVSAVLPDECVES